MNEWGMRVCFAVNRHSRQPHLTCRAHHRKAISPRLATRTLVMGRISWLMVRQFLSESKAGQWATSGHMKKGKRFLSHRYNRIPFAFRPWGILRELVAETCPAQR